MRAPPEKQNPAPSVADGNRARGDHVEHSPASQPSAQAQGATGAEEYFQPCSKKGRGRAQRSVNLIEAMTLGGGSRSADHRSRHWLQAFHSPA